MAEWGGGSSAAKSAEERCFVRRIGREGALAGEDLFESCVLKISLCGRESWSKLVQ